MAHVLDAASKRDVGRPERDLSCCRRQRRKRARAHAVDGEAGHGFGEPGEERDVAAERQALVADLRGRGHDDVADAVGRDRGVAAEQLPHRLHRHVVGARAPELSLRSGLAERRPDAVDEEDFARLPHDRPVNHTFVDSPA